MGRPPLRLHSCFGSRRLADRPPPTGGQTPAPTSSARADLRADPGADLIDAAALCKTLERATVWHTRARTSQPMRPGRPRPRSAPRDCRGATAGGKYGGARSGDGSLPWTLRVSGGRPERRKFRELSRNIPRDREGEHLRNAAATGRSLQRGMATPLGDVPGQALQATTVEPPRRAQSWPKSSRN